MKKLKIICLFLAIILSGLYQTLHISTHQIDENTYTLDYEDSGDPEFRASTEVV